MKQIFLRLSAVLVLVSSLFLTSLAVHANTPTLSISATGSGDSVTISVYGDPYSNVVLYYQNNVYSTQSQFIGTTNSSGYLSTTVSTSSYGVTAGSTVYVIVNNQTSSSVAWPYNYNNNNNYNCYNYGYNYGNCYGSLTLSQTNVSVAVGQSVSITISGGNLPYTMYTTGTNIFQAVISGNTLQVSGLYSGSGSVNVCSSGGTGSGCVVLSVTVNPTNYYVPPINYYNPAQLAITFSQNSPTLYVGQNMTISVSGGNSYNYGYYSGNYYVAYNSNSSVLSASVSGNTMTIQGLANGNASVVICSSSTNCSALNVTVGGVIVYGNQSTENWTYCANENQFCSFSGTRNVRYGANGIYVYRMITNGTTCSNAVFGDPIFGVAKSCSISY